MELTRPLELPRLSMFGRADDDSFGGCADALGRESHKSGDPHNVPGDLAARFLVRKSTDAPWGAFGSQ